MNRGGTETTERFQMRDAAISFVAGKAVFRIVFIQFDHHCVPRHLGENRRGRDGKTQLIPLDNRSLLRPNFAAVL